MWRVGRCSARLWGGTTPTPALGKAAPSLLPPPGNPPLPKKAELDLPQGCPEARAKPGFAPLRRHGSIMEIPEHKGASQHGGGCTGTRPAWHLLVSPEGTNPPRVPMGTSLPISSPQGSCPSHPLAAPQLGTCSATNQGKLLSFSPLFAGLEQTQQRHPRAGLEPATAAQAWLEQGAAGAQGEREGGWRRPKAPRARVFMERETTFPAGSAKGTRSQGTRELLCSTGISSRTVWVLGCVQEEKCGISILD